MYESVPAFLQETNCTIASPAEVTRADVAEYLAHHSERDTSGTTRTRALAVVFWTMSDYAAGGRPSSWRRRVNSSTNSVRIWSFSSLERNAASTALSAMRCIPSAS